MFLITVCVSSNSSCDMLYKINDISLTNSYGYEYHAPLLRETTNLPLGGQDGFAGWFKAA